MISIRNFVFIFISLLSCSALFAQSEKLRTLPQSELKKVLKPNQSVVNGWLVSQTKGDALLGTKDDVQYFWTDGRCSVNLFPDQHRVVCSINNGIFDLNDKQVLGIVGYYDENNNLVDKGNEWFRAANSSYDYVYLMQSHSDFIINYIKKKHGFVRFVISTYGSTPQYDITVRCLTEDTSIQLAP